MKLRRDEVVRGFAILILIQTVLVAKKLKLLRIGSNGPVGALCNDVLRYLVILKVDEPLGRVYTTTAHKDVIVGQIFHLEGDDAALLTYEIIVLLHSKRVLLVRFNTERSRRKNGVTVRHGDGCDVESLRTIIGNDITLGCLALHHTKV